MTGFDEGILALENIIEWLRSEEVPEDVRETATAVIEELESAVEEPDKAESERTETSE